MRSLLLTGLAILLLNSTTAMAYPELTRHGYINCTACHVSPTGGGTLTPYGRQLSREILSTWGVEGEERPAYFIDQPEWLNLGGDYRSVYNYQNTPRIQQSLYQFMQLDLEAAAQFGKFTLDASVGYQDPDAPNTTRDYLISRTHYLMYHFTDEIALRGGRFFPGYGIVSHNHGLLVRDAFGIQQPEPLGDGESYNLEFSYLGPTYNLLVTGIFGRPDEPQAQKDTGALLVASEGLGDTSKVGMSYEYGTSDFRNRHLFGPFGILGFTKSLYLLSEVDFQGLTPKTAPGFNPVQWGFAETSRLGYEAVKGLNLIVDQEFGRLNFGDPRTLQQRYGAGVWWFPRPHLELSVEYQRRKNPQLGFTDFYDFAFLLWHIYI